MIDRLRRYVAIPSLSRHENALADCVQGELQAARIRVERSGNNVWCEIGDAERPRLLLNSHLDTVPPADGWQGDPYQPACTDDRVVGLGANDAKGCVVAIVETAINLWKRRLAGQRIGGTIVVALTAEEEISGQGLSAVLGRLRPLDAAIVGEPTGMQPMTAQRGLLILKGITRGQSAHPANTPTGLARNAVVAAARAMLQIERFDWGPTHPLLGKCHGHVTTVRGGTASNVIPDRCEFDLDIRTTPAESHRALFERLSAAIDCEFSVHSERLVPVETNPREPIVQAVLSALPNTRPAGSPAMSDMVFLSDVPTVKIGPGDSTRSHTANEFIARAELEAGASGYLRITEEYLRRYGTRSVESQCPCDELAS